MLLLALLGCADDERTREDEKGFSFGTCPDSVDLTPPGVEQALLERVQLQCATLTVPLDHAKPDGDKLELAVIRARSGDGPPPGGAVVLNPGGPGQSGLERLPYWSTVVSSALLDQFDLISFDPRGTGISAPVNCGPLPDDDEPSVFPDLLTPTGFTEAAAYFDRLTASCVQRLGDRASHFGTAAAAEDLDLLRAALGEEKLTYVGFSYGAKLGGEYARRFPDKVRALVLDAPSDPRISPIAIAERQVRQFESSFDAFAADCPTKPACADRLGNDPRRFVADLVRSANERPIRSGRPGDDLPATGSDVLGAIRGLLYSDETWPAIADVLAEARGGDAGAVFEALDNAQGPDQEDLSLVDVSDANYVINCDDAAPGPSDQEVRRAANRFADRYPMFGAWSSWQLFGCSRWTPGHTVLEDPVAPQAPPLLVIGTLGDPATPYAGAVQFTATLRGSGRLLTWEGEGHTAYLRSPCVNDLVDGYLIDLTLPPQGTRCPR